MAKDGKRKPIKKGQSCQKNQITKALALKSSNTLLSYMLQNQYKTCKRRLTKQFRSRPLKKSTQLTNSPTNTVYIKQFKKYYYLSPQSTSQEQI